MTKGERQRLREVAYDMLTSGRTEDDVTNLALRLHGRGEIAEQIRFAKRAIENAGRISGTQQGHMAGGGV